MAGRGRACCAGPAARSPDRPVRGWHAPQTRANALLPYWAPSPEALRDRSARRVGSWPPAHQPGAAIAAPPSPESVRGQQARGETRSPPDLYQPALSLHLNPKNRCVPGERAEWAPGRQPSTKSRNRRKPGDHAPAAPPQTPRGPPAPPPAECRTFLHVQLVHTYYSSICAIYQFMHASRPTTTPAGPTPPHPLTPPRHH